MVIMISANVHGSVLSDQLISQDYRVRDAALKQIPTLAATEKHSLAQELCAHLKSPDITVLGLLGSAFMRLEWVNASPALIEFLKENPGNTTAISTLSSFDAAAIPAMIDLLKSDQPVLKSQALYVLKGIRSPIDKAVPATGDLLQEPDEELRYQAVEFLATMHQRNSAATAQPQLIRALKDNSARVRNAAVHVLGRIGDEKAVPYLVRGLEDTEHPLARAEVIQALRSIGTDPAWEALEELGVKRPLDKH